LGNDKEAIEDEEWIARIFGHLKMNWANSTASEVQIEPIEYYL
jgi:hypothetical protein